VKAIIHKIQDRFLPAPKPGQLAPGPDRGGAIVRAPVVTVRVAGTGSLPSGVIEAGEMVQVETAGIPEQFKVTFALNPKVGVMVNAKLDACPAGMLVEGGEAESTKSEPFPLRLITCGLAGALSVIVSEPVLAPDPAGVNVTLIVQLAFTARAEPHVLVCVKSPLATMLAMLSGAEPLLVRTTCCTVLPMPTGWLVNVRLVVERLAIGCSSPVPVSRST